MRFVVHTYGLIIKFSGIRIAYNNYKLQILHKNEMKTLSKYGHIHTQYRIYVQMSTQSPTINPTVSPTLCPHSKSPPYVRTTPPHSKNTSKNDTHTCDISTYISNSLRFDSID